MTSRMASIFEYSVITPVKNERENLPRLIDEIRAVMSTLGASWELICVDDGSTDGSYELLLEMSRIHPQLAIVKFDRNYGQSAALQAGWLEAKGKWVITLDADLQNDPDDIRHMAPLKADYDLINGWRIDRKDTFQKRWISKVANWIRSKMCEDGVKDTGCSLKIMRREGLTKIFWFKGAHRFLPALFGLYGYKVGEIPVRHRPRHKGQSHYSIFNRSIAPIVDMFAFIWLRRRHIRYKVESVHASLE